MTVPRRFYSSLCMYYSGPFATWRNPLWAPKWLGPFCPGSIFPKNSLEKYLVTQRVSAACSAKTGCDLHANLHVSAGGCFSSVRGIHLQFLRCSCAVLHHVQILDCAFNPFPVLILCDDRIHRIPFTFGFSKQWVTEVIKRYPQNASPYLLQKREVFSKCIIWYFNYVKSWCYLEIHRSEEVLELKY